MTPIICSTGTISQVAGNPLMMMGTVAVACTAFLYGLLQLIGDLRRNEKRRIENRLMGEGRTAGGTGAGSLIRKQMAGDGKGVQGMFARLRPVAAFQQACLQADLDWNAGRTLFRLICLGAAAAMVLSLLGLEPAWCVGFGAAVLVVPVMYVLLRRRRRLTAIVEQLPEAFDMMAQALRSGQSLSASLALVGEQLPDPISTEFCLVCQEQNLGVRLEDALDNLRGRVNQMDVTFFVTAVQIQRQTGGDLAEVLDNIGSVIRDRIKLQGLVRSLTAEGRLSGWVLLALPVIMLIAEMLLNPNYADELLATDTGHKMLLAAGISQLFGLAMIRKIVNVKY